MNKKSNKVESKKAPPKRELLAQLEEGLQGLFESESYKNWLSMCSLLLIQDLILEWDKNLKNNLAGKLG